MFIYFSLQKMDNELEANYVALKILKERCEILQHRLDTVEEENYKLNLERLQEYNEWTTKTSVHNKSSSSCKDISLEKQIMVLSQQNSQMSHQIKMLTVENRSLWSQLAKLMLGKEDVKQMCLSSYIKTEQNDNPEAKGKKLAKTFFSGTSNSVILDENSKESLEEISLKLINGILMGKMELENQYSEMIDLQRDSNDLDLKNFTQVSSNFNEGASNNLRSYIQKLKDFKQILFQQKQELLNAMSNIKNSKKSLPNAGNTMNELSKSASVNVPQLLNVNKDEYSSEFCTFSDIKLLNGEEESESIKICPLCGNSFAGKFTDFYAHVSNHFEDENEEYVDANTAFEIMP